VLDRSVVRLSTVCSFSERIIPMTRNETVTRRMTGNGLVIERTERVGGAIPWWWIADASRVPKTLSQTYHHREMLKAYGCRWSHKRPMRSPRYSVRKTPPVNRSRTTMHLYPRFCQRRTAIRLN
jgi:hypothetical protein